MKDISVFIDNRLRTYMLDMNGIKKSKSSDNITFNLTISIPKTQNTFLITLKMRADASFKNGLRDSVQISRAILYEIGGVMTYPLDDNRIVLIQEHKNPTIKKKLDELLLNDFEYTMKRVNGDDEILSRCSIFTMLCNLLKTGKWIHVGKSMDYLVSSDFKQNSTDKQSISFSCNIEKTERETILKEEKLKITLKMIVYIVLMNTIQVNNNNRMTKDMIGSSVLCLPKCSGYARINSYKSSNENKDFLISYWYHQKRCHGYFLEPKDVELTVNVSFKNSSYDYPSSLLLKSQIVILPFKSEQYKQQAIKTIHKDIEGLGDYVIEYVTPVDNWENEIDELSYKSKWVSKSKTKLLLPPINTFEVKSKNFKKHRLPPIEYCVKNKSQKCDDLNVDDKNLLTNEFWSNVNQQIEKFM